jgi:uncharacterized protein YjbI with pentapeptide repeats
MRPSQRQVTFRETDDARYPFEAVVDGKTWTVRINEPSLYSLIVDGEVVEELMEWPAAWTRPGAPATTQATATPAAVPPPDVPRARTLAEMDFAASLEPCPRCGSRSKVELDLIGSGDRWTLSGTCPRCATPRAFTFRTFGDPLKGAYQRRHLGDERPSQIIRPGKFIAEVDRLIPHVRTTPEELPPIDWRASTAANERLITCLLELAKFVPPGAEAIPDEVLDAAERADRAARPERYTRAWIDAELARSLALSDRYTADAPRIWKLEERGETGLPAQGEIDRDSLRAHERWLAAGRSGNGRLVVAGLDASGMRLAGVEMTAARLERVDLSKSELEAAHLVEAELRDVQLDGARMSSVQLQRATIVGGSFVGADLALAVLEGARIEEARFDRADVDRSVWKGARAEATSFDAVVFGNAILDGVRFSGCTFRGADFAPLDELFPATTRGAVFEDCDLRNTRWDDRDLTGVRFVRCKLDGIQGRPKSVADIEVVEPDLSPDGDGSDIGTLDDVLDLWA